MLAIDCFLEIKWNARQTCLYEYVYENESVYVYVYVYV